MESSGQLWKDLLGMLALLLVCALLSLVVFGCSVPAPGEPVDPRSPWALPEAIWEGRWP